VRILLSTIGSRGDVQPLVALALQLKSHGHEVRLCVPPDFREWIDSFGVPVIPIGPEVRGAGPPRSPAASVAASADERRQLVQATVATQFQTLTAAAKCCDVIVAATALQVAARSVAEMMDIGYVFAAYSPTVLPSALHAPAPLPPVPEEKPAPATTDNRELWARNAERFNRTFGGALNSHRAAAGLPPVADVRRHMCTDRPWLAADPTLAPWPDDGEVVFQTGAWILPDHRRLSQEIETFLEEGDPPVYFGFGSMRAPQELARVMVHSARALGRRAILSAGWADLSRVDHQRDYMVIGEVNVNALFKRVAAVVHHGGAGTTTAAALAGAPQVVIPQIYDQHYWAERIHRLGIGTAHAPGAPTTASLTSALDQTLRRDVEARARSVAAAVRTDGTHVAAQRLIHTSIKTAQVR
jgi:vancomycin aglycone glucosyltransferase